MGRIATGLVLVLGTALLGSLSAHAARLDVLASSAAIAPGDPLSVSVLGDSEGETAVTAEAILAYTGNVTPSDATGPFELETTDVSSEWLATVFMGSCDEPELPPDSCVAVHAFAEPSRIDLLPGTLTVFDFDTSTAVPGSVLTFQALPFGADFFSAGPSEVVTVHVIPEPAPAALVALGLLAIVATGRTGGRSRNALIGVRLSGTMGRIATGLALVLSTTLLGSLSAGAARLEVLVSSATIAPGDPLSVSVRGDSEGATSTVAAAILLYTGDATPGDATGPFELETSNVSSEWLASVYMGRCDVPELPEVPPDSCLAVYAFGEQPFAIDLLPGTFSVFDFDTSLAVPGSVLTFQAAPAGGTGFDFFGAGPSEVVTVHVIPEPAPAVLVALGLLAIVTTRRAGGRRRAY